PAPTGGDAVGVITVAGTIVDGEAKAGTAGGDTIAKLLLDGLATKNLKALVVRVDSPGGSVLASERIRQAILQAKQVSKIP
ncbi:signal peptide peptidase SppA, partial [Escherichia coli]|nr:signal peptide peptidase SppA [Escherichia coli]